MKFNSIVLFATGALATPSMVKRQSVSAIQSDVQAIASAATALDSAIKSFSGINDAPALISASNAVVTAIKKAETDSNAITQTITISTPGVVDLVTDIQNLGNTVKTAISDLTAKKSTFAAGGLCGQVLDQIKAQQSAASGFQSALTSKLDSQLQGTAPVLVEPINTALASGASAFSSCPAVSGSSSASGSTSTGSVSSSTATASGEVSSSTCTTSTASASVVVTSTPTVVPTPTGNVTVPPTPTVIPNTNAGVKQIAGFGGLLAAAAFAVAAF